MEMIITLIQGVFVFGLIILGLGIIIFPIIAHLNYKENTGQSLLNFWLTGLEAIALLPALKYIGNTSKPDYAETMGFLIIVLIVTIIISNNRAKKMGFQGKEKFIVIAAQLLSPISVLIIFTILSGLFKKDDKSDKNG